MTRQCCNRTSPSKALSRWLRMQEEFSEPDREVSAPLPIRLPPSSPGVFSSYSSPGSSLLPALTQGLCSAISSGPSSRAAVAVPILILTLALPGLPPYPGWWGAHRVQGARGGLRTPCREEPSPAVPGQGYELFLAIDVIDAVLAGGSHWRAVLPTHYI